METIELPSLQTTLPNTSFLSPLSQTENINETQQTPINSPQAIIENTINELFALPVEENKIQRARTILGKKAGQASDEEIEIALTQFEFLANNWLDEFERKSFDGRTLIETLKLE